MHQQAQHTARDRYRISNKRLKCNWSGSREYDDVAINVGHVMYFWLAPNSGSYVLLAQNLARQPSVLYAGQWDGLLVAVWQPESSTIYNGTWCPPLPDPADPCCCSDRVVFGGNTKVIGTTSVATLKLLAQL